MRKHPPLYLVCALLVCALVPAAWATNPASEDFDYLDGDGYQPADANPFDDPPTGAAPAFWTGNGEYRSSASYGLIEEAPSGTNGIVSANGSVGHAEFYPNYAYGFDTFHRNGGGANGVAFTGPFSFKMDIYLSPSWTYRCPSGGCLAEDDFWINQGVNDNLPGPPNGNYLSEGSLRFNVTDIAPTDGIVEYSFHTGPGGPIGSLFQTITPGWYTLEQIVDVGPDGVDAGTDPDILFTHRIWNVARTQVLSNPNTYASFNGANANLLGGDRYSSFFYVHSNITPFVAIDNVEVGAPLQLILVVDDDGMGTAADCDDATACYSTISAAVAAASSGDLIHVCPGTYVEQVVVSGKDITIEGSGVGATFVHAPAVLATTFTTSGPNKPVITAIGADVVIQDLSVDGLGNGNANNRIVGIGYWNAGGAILDCTIDQIRNTPLDGVQAGVGILAANNTGGPYSLEVGDVTITDYQKNAMVLASTGLTIDVHDCSTTGEGPTALIAQNGIQISANASGTVSDCSISDMDYTPDTVVSAGLLVFDGGSVAVSGTNPITNVQEPVYWQDTDGSMSGIDVTGGADPYDAVFVYNSSTSAPGKASQPASTVDARIAAPFDGPVEGAAPGDGRTPAATYTVSISNSCLIGSGLSATNVGIYAYSAGGPLTVSATNNEIEDWDRGIVADGAAVAMTANDNSITSNATAGFDNTLSASAQDAESNWWGAANGPSGVGPGTGDAVLGSGVDFSPWLITGTDTNGGCGFSPGPDNVITPGPVTSCISADSTCITVPVKIFRTTSDSLKGFSVSFHISPELDLCTTVGASITEGTYLSSANPVTNYQVTPIALRAWTVDCAILGGSPCGTTAATGTLFNIRVKKSGADGTGTVTVDSVITRDCDNGAIASTPGAPVSITIDSAAPAAVTNLAASQVKTGNDADGTTKITLTFTAPGGAAVVEVYRAPWGGYPEYDDAGFLVAPATPSYPPGPPWTLTAVTTTGTTDEVLIRDFWYYVMFTKDACGNVSAVSNKTTGTLNYHLGDVHNGATNCVGNNLVNTSDMTFLGANYGVTGLPLNDPVNCLDVGPTTDFSVNARPTTDNRIQFEDLILFAINYGPPISKSGERPVAESEDAVTLASDAAAKAEGVLTARLEASGTGRVQGISTRLSWDPAVVTPVSMAAGELLERNGGVAFAPEPGVVDAAVLGTEGGGLSGRGTLATVTFRVIGAGDPRIALESVDARDAENKRVEFGMKLAQPGREAESANRTELLPNIPNPFNPMTKVAFRLAESGDVDLSVFTADGRKVRTLASGRLNGGLHEMWWDGRDDGGGAASSGTYYLKLKTASGNLTRSLMLLK